MAELIVSESEPFYERFVLERLGPRTIKQLA
jgi:hypothetical protein